MLLWKLRKQSNIQLCNKPFWAKHLLTYTRTHTEKERKQNRDTERETVTDTHILEICRQNDNSQMYCKCRIPERKQKLRETDRHSVHTNKSDTKRWPRNFNEQFRKQTKQTAFIHTHTHTLNTENYLIRFRECFLFIIYVKH